MTATTDRIGAARGGSTVGVGQAVRTFLALKWHVLLGSLRRSGQARLQVISALVASFLLGAFGLLILMGIGRNLEIADDLLVVLLPAAVFGVGLLSAATGVESTVDPRAFAGEPIGQWHLGLGMLATAVIGPPAVLAALMGFGVLGGWWITGVGPGVVVMAAVLGWWMSLLLFSRTLANLLGAVATTKFRQLAHAGATLASLGALLVTQLLAANPESWNAQRWESMADVARWTPPGQLGLAITGAGDPVDAAGHLVAGLLWLPVLLLVVVASTQRLARSSPRPGGGGRGTNRRFLAVRDMAGGGRTHGGPLRSTTRVRAIGARTILTKVRTPRQAVNTVTALAVGGAVYFLGPLLGTAVDSRLVIMGGAIHFAVLFDGNNAFGMDGAAIWSEILAGADGRTLVRGKVRSSLLVMIGPGLVLPVALAAMTGGWRWIPAGWLVAVGSVTAAAGVAVLSAVLAPFALPDSPNPLAGGDTGQGCLAGLMLTGSVLALAVVTAPVALGIYFASEVSAPLATLVSLVAPLAGLGAMWAGVTLATARVQGYEAELMAKVTPGR
jgi:hypothetical protein